jgi:hypothetical protein
MASYDAFLRYVLPDVPGCPEISAVAAIRDAAIDFCTKSLVYQETLDPITVIAGVADYDLEPPTGTLVAKVMHLFYQDKELTPVAPDLIRGATFYNSRVEGAQSRGIPSGYSLKDPRSVTLMPVPKDTERNAVTVRVALKPTRSSTTVGDVLFEDYAETIAAGALARLMLTPGKAYTNPQLVAENLAIFSQGVNAARQEHSRGHSRANLRVKMVRV